MPEEGSIFKIMLLGDVSTGKTSFLTQLIYQNAEKMPKSTTELSFFTLSISNPSAIIQIWDTPGDQRFYFKAVSILSQFQAILIFVDVTNEQTLNRAKLMIDQLKVFPEIDVHLVESKLSIVEKTPYKRKVASEQIEQLCKKVSKASAKFEYSQDEKLESTLEQIVTRYYSSTEHRNRRAKKADRKIFDKQPKLDQKGQNHVYEDTQTYQACDCSIF